MFSTFSSFLLRGGDGYYPVGGGLGCFSGRSSRSLICLILVRSGEYLLERGGVNHTHGLAPDTARRGLDNSVPSRGDEGASGAVFTTRETTIPDVLGGTEKGRTDGPR